MLEPQCIVCKRLVIAALGMLALAWAGLAGAAQAPCGEPEYRQFDFWLGTWEVEAADGRRAGRNVISREQGGCLLVERWAGVQDSTGLSMNYYDPAAGQWRQLWVSPGVQIDIAGGLEAGSMVLEGTILYLDGVRSQRFRGTWTPLEDGRVRQFFEQHDAEADAWQPWFEGFYRRVAAESEGDGTSSG